MFLTVMYSIIQIIFPGNFRGVPQLDKNICSTSNCFRAAEMFSNSMSTAVPPCDNFFEYACANYPNIYEIPPYKDHFTAYLVRQAHVNKVLSSKRNSFYTYEQLFLLLGLGYIKKINLVWPKGFQKVRTYYDLCMNEEQRRKVGYKTLQDELAIIGMELIPPYHLKTSSRNDYSAIIGKIHRFSVRASNFLHSVSVWPSHADMKLNTLVIGSIIEATANESEENEPRLLPEDELLIQSRQRYMIAVVNHLYNYCQYQLTEEVKKEIKQRVHDVLALEESLHKMIRSLRIENTMIVEWKPFELRNMLNKLLEGGEIQIDYIAYLEVLFAGYTSPNGPSLKTMLESEDSSLMITIQGFREFASIYQILHNTSSSIFESYIWWTVVESILEEGPLQLYQYRNGFLALELGMSGPPTQLIPRDITCMTEIKRYFGKFVGYALAKKTNGQMKKKKITEMFENLKKSYEESIQRTHWSDSETKEATLAKIHKMTAFIGYDDSVLKSKTIDQEYRKIDIQPENYYKILADLFRKERKDELFKVLAKNDFNHKPEINPADSLGSRYIRAYNYVSVPIIDIQFPYWDLGLEVLHYATLGFIVGHEMGHSIDETGSLFNAEGDGKHCLTDHAAKAYSNIVECFVEAYNKLHVFIPDHGFLSVNGQISVNENMADWQGFNMAMMTYKKFAKNHDSKPKLPGTLSELNSEQLFSLGFANQFCVNGRTNFLIRSTSTLHAPERARVNGVLKNSKQFSDAWGCTADAPMNPPGKCEIWF